MDGVPALVRNRRLDILYANRLGYGLCSEMYRDPIRPANPARFVFFDPRSRDFFVDWNRAADDMVALLRGEVGRSPSDRALSELIEDLAGGSDTFRDRWARHEVLYRRTGVGRFHHPIAGEMTLIYEDLDIAADPGQTILVFTAEPGSESHHALGRVADWVATHDPTRPDAG